ncbi:helix-turn-helix transcriptional regulator [Paenibacillus sp. GSMTC-2017]|uniref:AraC family transcriptional regulator n=1 Tax=Paenibacillus sp. GSMTC-2017 TaxID=2794350 RepID=UPI0018D7A93D|nr:AraC family transcriptional regulator [Paenibacillus sp. GSMTC-2017]MBH5317034.1 helix-turn-helix transcriptional regulator [Paenibacillus sp. GSMTC-2017]
MTYFPDYLKTYPNMNTSNPLHISLNRLPRGFRPHRHDFLEFSFVIDGNGFESINEAKHPMQAGTFTFVLPYQVHELFTEPGSTLILYNCMFGMDLLLESGINEGLLTLIERGGAPYVQLSEADNERMRHLVEDMYREYNNNLPWRSVMLQQRLKEILVLFDRARQKKNPESTQTMVEGKRSASVWPIIHFIHQHYQDEIALSSLAKRYSMSVSRISEVIKETTGQTFVHFLRDLRIRHACSLLASTEMNIAEIAMEVGYGSYPTFSRVFRESKGMSPKDYRRLKLASRDDSI